MNKFFANVAVYGYVFLFIRTVAEGFGGAIFLLLIFAVLLLWRDSAEGIGP